MSQPNKECKAADEDALFDDFELKTAMPTATHTRFDLSDDDDDDMSSKNARDASEMNEDDSLFMLDKDGDINVNESTSSLDFHSVGDDLIIPGKSVAPRRQAISCFNCNGPHRIDACDKPRDGARIAKNRRAQQAKSQDQNRYHGEDKNGGGRPGRISKQLEEALGIRWGELPEWIYRMRRMGLVKGYPPGYLKMACGGASSADTLSFHSVDPTTEEAEQNDTEKRGASPTVDLDKVVYYYGFNVESRGSRRNDDYQYPQMPMFGKLLEDELKKRHHTRLKAAARQCKTDATTSKEDANGKEEAVEDAEDEPPSIDGGDPVVALSSTKSCPALLEQSATADDDTEALAEEAAADSSCGGAVTPRKNGGGSMSSSLGTPTLRAGDVIAAKPTLESFGTGIVPFEPKEEPPPGVQGGLNRIKELIASNRSSLASAASLSPQISQEQLEAGEIEIIDEIGEDDEEIRESPQGRKREWKDGARAAARNGSASGGRHQEKRKRW